MKASFVFFLAIIGCFITINGAAPPVCPEPGDIAVTLPNPDDCSKFYLCDGHTPVPQDCMTGLWFNPALGVCDYPENIPNGVCKPPAKK